MRHPEHLTSCTRTDVLRKLQHILWCDDDTGKTNPDKEWSPDTLDDIAEVMRDAGLAPVVPIVPV